MDEIPTNENRSILFVSSECVPFSARGGLADFSQALPKYLSRNKNIDIRVALPYYSTIPDEFKSAFKLVGERTVELTWRHEYCGIYEYEYAGITYYFIDNKQYFDREKLYGYDDDVERFSYFSKAVLDMLPIVNFFPDIIHTNDWQTGMVCAFLKILEWQNPKYEHIKTVLTIHNLAYQGNCDFGAVKDLLGVEDKFAYLFDFFGSANTMKASILCADQIVAVSETYMQEILTQEHGCGLDSVLESVRHKFTFVANGVDYESFNPETDTNIYNNYSLETIDSRKQNKLELQKEMGFDVDENIPLYCFVGFMDNGKGIDMLSTFFENYISMGVQFVAVGCGLPEFESFFTSLAEKYPDRVKAFIGYDANLPRKLYAGCDFILSLANTEPCGLTPLIANKYGCLPIVYLTGGIKDNFTDFKYSGGNGYVLKDYDVTSLSDLISRTLRNFNEKDKLGAYRQAAMEQNFDITSTVEGYISLYEKI